MTDSEMTSDDQSQAKGGLPSPPTHSLRRSSQMMYNPDRYDPYAWYHLEKGEVVGSKLVCLWDVHRVYKLTLYGTHNRDPCTNSIRDQHKGSLTNL